MGILGYDHGWAADDWVFVKDLGRGKQQVVGGKKPENQICLGNRWWIEWPTADVGANTTEKEKNQVNLWLNSYLLRHQGLVKDLFTIIQKKTPNN